MFSNNCNGANNKIEALRAQLEHTRATIFNLQETHFTRKGKIKIDNFQIYEAIRKKEHGSMLGVHVSQKPVLISEYSEIFELLVVQVEVGRNQIRVMSGYGPQENLETDKRMPFFSVLEEEVVRAKVANKSIIIQLDANSKLGKDMIPGDPHDQTPNGAALAAIVKRNALTVGNSLGNRVKGLITRRRSTENGQEESIIDFLIVSDDLVDDVKEMVIDEKKEHALAVVRRKNGIVKVTTSDHNTILTTFRLEWSNSDRKERVEVFNMKNKECQQIFKEHTSQTNKLSVVFDSDDDINAQTKKFIKLLNKCIYKCFRKVKVSNSKETEYEKLYAKWVRTKEKDDRDGKKEADKLEKELADKYADKIYDQIKDEIEGLNCEEGGKNGSQLWKKLTKKLNPRYQEPPVAMKDDMGNILTSKEDILTNTVKHYKKVLANRDIKEGMEEHKNEREDLALSRMKEAALNKTIDWDINDLDIVLKHLKKDKSTDALGYINEIFKPEVIGSDLKLAVLKLMNKIKKEQIFPKCLELCNITSIFKKKGSKSDFNNYRGVFRALIFRTILERLIYNDEYPNIDMNLTDANVGARNKRNIRDNLFVIYAVK